jgi:hypothetical protein
LIFIVTGYSLDHVEHIIKQIFVMFNTNIQLGSLCTTNQTHTDHRASLLSQSFCCENQLVFLT